MDFEVRGGEGRGGEGREPGQGSATDHQGARHCASLSPPVSAEHRRVEQQLDVRCSCGPGVSAALSFACLPMRLRHCIAGIVAIL